MCLSAVLLTLGAGAALAQSAGPGVPQFQVDPFWPKALPNNWLFGQVSGIRTDRFDRIWVVHRPSSLNERERAAERNPPPVRCCVAPPPVLVFDQSGNLVSHWGGPGQGYNWPTASTAYSSTTTISSGSRAATVRTDKSSSSRWMVNS